MNLEENSEIDLVKYYAFEHEGLEKCFLRKCQDALSDYSYYMKIYQLLNFRLKYNDLFEINELLYSHADNLPINMKVGDFLHNFRKLPLDIKVDSFLENSIFKNIPCIREFFCYSTFPSIFYNFISAESFEIGYNFIKRCFDEQRILPLLISSFLLHSTFFQDRLISTFLNNIINSKKKVDSKDKNNLNNYFYKIESSKDEIWEDKYGLKLSEIKTFFYQSLEACTSYLNQYQIKIIQDLNEKDKDLTYFIISELFFKEIMKNLARYHSISNSISILSTNTSIKNPPNTLYIKRRNLLSDLYDELDFKQVINIICQSKMCYEFVKIDEMIIDDGYKITLSIADIKIISLMYVYTKLSPEQRNVSLSSLRIDFNSTVKYFFKNYNLFKDYEPNEFINDIFSLYFKQQEFIRHHKKKPKVTYTMDEMKKCKEVRECHRFLMNYSGHLNNLFLYVNSAIEVLRSKANEFVSEILLKQHVFDPYKYELDQIKLFLSTKSNENLLKLARSCESIMDFYKKEKPKTFFINADELTRNLTLVNDIVNDDSRATSRFVKTIGMISYLLYLSRMNNDKSSRNIGNVFDYDIKKEIDFSENPSSTINNNSGKENETNSNNNDKNEDNNNNDNGNENGGSNNDNPPLMVTLEYQNELKLIDEKIVSLVINNTGDYVDCLIQSDYDDFFVYYNDIREIILSTNNEMRNDCLFMRSEFNMGQIIKTLATIEQIIEKSIKKSVFEKDTDLQRFIFFWIFHPKSKISSLHPNAIVLDPTKECYYFKANLIKARSYLEKMFAANRKSNILMPNELWEASERLEKLAYFCNMKKRIVV